MKELYFKPIKLVVIGAALAAGVTVARADFSMQIVADNDFALFGGTATSVNDLIYQNDYSWPDQLANLSTITFNLQPGDTTFYLLGMGGGGVENISGTVNDVDLTSINISMSSDLAPYLTGYLVDGSADPSVADASYNASLADVQLALPNLTWGSPVPTFPWIDDVADQSPNGQGFHFDPDTAHLFSFDASDVGVTPAPEPSTWALMAIGLIILGKKNYSSRGLDKPTV